MRNLLERTFELGFKCVSLPGAPGCKIKAIVNKDGVKFSFYEDGNVYEFDAECNIFLGLLFCEIDAFTKMIWENLSYIPFSKETKFVRMYCDCFDWGHITKRMKEAKPVKQLDGYKDIIYGGINLKIKNPLLHDECHLEIRQNGDTVTLACSYLSGYVAYADVINRFAQEISEYIEVVFNDEKKLKLSY